MSGLYDDGKRIPLLEHSVDRRSTRQPGNDKLRICATWSLGIFSLFLLLSGSNQDEAAWWTTAWYCSAAAILGVSGRVGMVAWIRWTVRGSGYTRYLLHRARRLAPVHLLGIAGVLLCHSFLAMLLLADPMPWTIIGENIFPLMPSPGTWEVNPAWKILQVIVLGTLVLPLIRLLSFHLGSSVSAGSTWILFGVAIVLTKDPIWSEHMALLSCFAVGASASTAAAKFPVARTSLLLACSALGATSLVVGAALNTDIAIWIAGLATMAFTIAQGSPKPSKPGMANAMNYPVLVLHWPLLVTALAIFSQPDGKGIILGVTIASIILLAASCAIGRFVECRVDILSAQDGERAHQSSRQDSEKSDFTSNPS